MLQFGIRTVVFGIITKSAAASTSCGLQDLYALVSLDLVDLSNCYKNSTASSVTDKVRGCTSSYSPGCLGPAFSDSQTDFFMLSESVNCGTDYKLGKCVMSTLWNTMYAIAKISKTVTYVSRYGCINSDMVSYFIGGTAKSVIDYAFTKSIVDVYSSLTASAGFKALGNATPVVCYDALRLKLKNMITECSPLCIVALEKLSQDELQFCRNCIRFGSARVYADVVTSDLYPTTTTTTTTKAPPMA